MKRAPVFLLVLFLLPSTVSALGRGERHWYGLGAGWTAGKDSRPAGLLVAGGLWAGMFGMGGIFQFPLDETVPGQEEFTALGSLDYFLYQGRTHLALLAGATEFQRTDGSDYVARFTVGGRFAWTVPLTPRWHLGVSVMPLWTPSWTPNFRMGLSVEMQLRY